MRIAIKLSVPIAFFGYAIFANVMLLQERVEAPQSHGFLKGEFAQEIDGIYRDNLPHREVAVSWIGAARYLALSEGREGVVVGEDGWLFSDEEFRDLGEAQSLNETMAWISDVDAQLSALGAELVLVPLPAKLDVMQAQIAAPQSVAFADGLYADFLDVLTGAGISHVDTRPALTQLDAPFLMTDTHWTIAGAESVAQAVNRSGLIPEGDAVFEKDAQAVERFSGDLVSFVTSDTLAPFVGLPAEQIEPYLAKAATADLGGGGLDLFGNDGPQPIALVGTSYSANPRWSFVEALKLSLSHDVINHALEGQGPVAPMRAFLDGLDPIAPPPFVIWEFPVRYLTDPSLMEAVTDAEEAGNA